MADPFRILAISGSLRKASFNRGLIRAAQGLVPEGVVIETAEIDALPHYNADIEAAGDPPSVSELKDRIRDADALLLRLDETAADPIDTIVVLELADAIMESRLDGAGH